MTQARGTHTTKRTWALALGGVAALSYGCAAGADDHDERHLDGSEKAR